MPICTPSNAQNALVDLELSAVALCGEGANSRADIIFNKSRKEKDKMPETFEELLKALDPKQAELVNTHIAALTKKHSEAVDALNSQIDELKKAKPAAPQSTEEVLKGASPEIIAMFKKQQEQLDALIAKDAEELAKSRFEKCKALPVEEAALKEVLKAASPAVVEILEKAAAAIEASSHTATGTAAPAQFLQKTADGLYAEIEKAAKKIQEDEQLSFEKAFAKACEQNPDLYNKYRNEVR